MRGIILAGGRGCRLGAMTASGINKHVLPVGDVPMIYQPLRVLLCNSITDITIVSSPSGVGQLAELLGSGKKHGCQFTYRVQDQPGGIAEALKAAKTDSNEQIAVILGDNVFLPSPHLKLDSQDMAKCYVKEIDEPAKLKELGIMRMETHKIVEKPEHPPSKYAVTGLYLFNPDVWERLEKLKPSGRGELEITDLLNSYDKLCVVSIGCFWGDAGTPEGMTECAEAIRRYQ